MAPQEIGFAAAYEAYRQTKHSISAYTDYEQQREAQRGLAMAEGLPFLYLSRLTWLTTIPKPRTCGRTRVAEWTNMAHRWRARLRRRQLRT
jgi:hypothetical protein